MRPIAVRKAFGNHVFIPAGCIHWPLSEKHLVDAWIEKIKDTRNAFTLLCGDTFDFSRGHFRKHNKSYTEDETSILALDEWHKKDIVELAKKLEPIKDKILGVILGNHYHQFCLDSGVEALTRNGWKKHQDISVGDEILAFNPEDFTTRWETTKDIYVGPYVGEAYDTALCTTTPQHKWFGRTRRQNKHHVYFAGDTGFPKHLVVPVCGEPKSPTEETVPDWLVWIVGLVITDGMLVRCATKPSMNNRVRIFQKASSEKARIIESWLRKSDKKFTFHTRKDGIGVFEFSGELAGLVRSTINDKKVLLYSWLQKLSKRQVRLLFDAFVFGDGSGKDKVCQKNRDVLEPLQAAMSWSGIPNRLSKPDCAGMSLLSKKTREYTTLKQKKTYYSGTVWCPTVESGFWVARKNGRVFVTGNSDGTTSEQYLCQLLKIPFLGTTGMVRLDFASKSKMLNHLVIYAHHGTGGGITIGGDANSLEKKEAGFDADIYVLSHTHRRHAFKTEQLKLSSKGTPSLRTRQRVFIRTGTFLKGYAHDNPVAERAYQAPYAEKMGLRPTSLGYVEVLIGMTHISHRERDITAQRAYRQEVRTTLDVKF